jgi:isoquinoline 1-oxidoreductase beta subunit
MHTDSPKGLSRRDALKGGAGLVIAAYVAPRHALAKMGAAASAPAPNAFLRIAPDDTVTVIVKHLEFGQGPMTGLTTLVAEELGADWSQMRAEHAPANAALYNNLAFGPMQGTGGSTAIANSYVQMRLAGAAAREMLIAAAANEWRAPVKDIVIEKGELRLAGGGKSARIGVFAEAAAKLPVPANPTLKDLKDFRLIGKEGAVQKLDVPEKTNGKALYTIDIYEPDMVTVVVAHPPQIGARPGAVDDTAARAIYGVIDVKTLSTGVAVIASGMWAALKGREALKVAWSDAGAETRDSDQIFDDLAKLAATPGAVAAQRGDVDKALASSARVIEAEYRFPYLAHAPMEPRDGAMIFDGKRVKARFGSQLQTLDQMQIAKIFGVGPANVEIETVFAGGSFGRRIDLGEDMLGELAETTKAVGPDRWVKLVWTREDDIRGGFYRPMIVHKMRSAIEGDKIVAWSDTIAGRSIAKGTAFEGQMIKDGVDTSMVEGAKEIPYDIPNFRCDAHMAEGGPRVLFWRSVGSTHTAFAVEAFIDEALTAMGKDPVEGRLALLAKSPREAGVLRAVAEMANWSGGAAAQGRGRGVALAKSFGTYTAEIAEVSLGPNGEPRVHKVWCAVDCGVAVNPDVIRAQMEGGIGFGLSHALYSEITLKGGRVVARNFDGYRSLRVNEMPEIEVRIVPSSEAPTGVGEPGVPPIGPAVANALARLKGERARRLPFVRGVV